MYEPGAGPDGSYDSIPSVWSKIRFGVVDVLYVSPFIVNVADGSFDFDNIAAREQAQGHTGTLVKRLQWIVQNARLQNPAIKILAQRFWGGNDLQDLKSSQYDHYASSVRALVKTYGLDGYDLDYESRADGADGNVISQAPTILSKIRAQLDQLKDEVGKPLYVSISPATTKCLDETVAQSLHYVNIQTYAGGSGLTLTHFTDLGFRKHQLLYGILPESTEDSKPIDVVTDAYKGNGGNDRLPGIHLWRLNSHNLDFENKVQALIYDFLHSTHSGGYDAQEVRNDFASGKWDYNQMKARGEIQ